ncbi:hypothetical protein ACFL0Y_03660 [Patescibacteria group bacterium]
MAESESKGLFRKENAGKAIGFLALVGVLASISSALAVAAVAGGGVYALGRKGKR